MIAAEEVAGLVAFLASDCAAAITGAEYLIEGTPALSSSVVPPTWFHVTGPATRVAMTVPLLTNLPSFVKLAGLPKTPWSATTLSDALGATVNVPSLVTAVAWSRPEASRTVPCAALVRGLQAA